MEEVFDNVHVAHLHGDIDSAESLYLPAEIAWEPYRKLRTRRIYVGIDPKPWQFWKMRLARYPDNWNVITSANWLVSKATRLIVAGLSFSPFDAELRHLVTSIANPQNTIRELIIIDRSPAPILKRISFHARGRIGDARLFTPEAF